MQASDLFTCQADAYFRRAMKRLATYLAAEHLRQWCKVYSQHYAYKHSVQPNTHNPWRTSLQPPHEIRTILNSKLDYTAGYTSAIIQGEQMLSNMLWCLQTLFLPNRDSNLPGALLNTYKEKKIFLNFLFTPTASGLLEYLELWHPFDNLGFDLMWLIRFREHTAEV